MENLGNFKDFSRHLAKIFMRVRPFDCDNQNPRAGAAIAKISAIQDFSALKIFLMSRAKGDSLSFARRELPRNR
jgi:hypothetical protein